MPSSPIERRLSYLKRGSQARSFCNLDPLQLLQVAASRRGRCLLGTLQREVLKMDWGARECTRIACFINSPGHESVKLYQLMVLTTNWLESLKQFFSNWSMLISIYIYETFSHMNSRPSFTESRHWMTILFKESKRPKARLQAPAATPISFSNCSVTAVAPNAPQICSIG